MGPGTYKRLLWALIGAIIGMILFVPSLWLGDVILGGLTGFGIAYGVAAWALRRREQPGMQEPDAAPADDPT